MYMSFAVFQVRKKNPRMRFNEARAQRGRRKKTEDEEHRVLAGDLMMLQSYYAMSAMTSAKNEPASPTLFSRMSHLASPQASAVQLCVFSETSIATRQRT